MNEANGSFNRNGGKSPVSDEKADIVQLKKVVKQAVDSEKVPEHLRAMIAEIVRNS